MLSWLTAAEWNSAPTEIQTLVCSAHNFKKKESFSWQHSLAQQFKKFEWLHAAIRAIQRKK